MGGYVRGRNIQPGTECPTLEETIWQVCREMTKTRWDLDISHSPDIYSARTIPPLYYML